MYPSDVVNLCTISSEPQWSRGRYSTSDIEQRVDDKLLSHQNCCTEIDGSTGGDILECLTSVVESEDANECNHVCRKHD